jgi:predicted nucleic acid-binding protein
MNNILIDTGFWFALYDKRDSNYWKANELFEFLSIGHIIIPYPSLYETINTRFVKNKIGLSDFKQLLSKRDIHLLDDSVYKSDALNLTFDSSINKDKNYSLVDMVIRLILSDDKLNINYLISFNPGDFIDICSKRRIEILTE